MEKNNNNDLTPKEKLIFLGVVVFIIGLIVGMVIELAISTKDIAIRDKEIEELKMENAVLKEENQDIMGLWSDLVIEKK